MSAYIRRGLSSYEYWKIRELYANVFKSCLLYTSAEEGYGVTILLLLQYKVDYEMHKDIRIIDLSGNDKSRLLHTFFWIKMCIRDRECSQLL